MGFTFAIHYCGGRAVKSKMMLGNNDLGCGMVQFSCEKEGKGTAVKKKNCCSNDYLSLEIENDFEVATVQSTVDFNFVVAFVTTFIERFRSSTELEIAFGDYSPPLQKQAVQVLFQSFLI